MNTDRLNADSVDLDPESVLVALQAVVADVDGFLSGWLQRIEHCAVTAEGSTEADERLRVRIRAFQSEQRTWESQRNREASEIKEKTDQLTQAWLQLESDQRRFLQQAGPDRPASANHDASCQMNQREPTGTARVPTDRVDTALIQSGNDESAALEPESHEHASLAHVNHSRDVAVRQFQRLRREIESSRPNTGRPSTSRPSSGQL